MTKFTRIALCTLLLGSTAVITSCSNDDDNQAPAAKTIYAQLGGTTKVADPDNAGQMIEQGRLSYRKVVNSTIGLIVADIQSGATGNLGAHFAPIVGEVTAGNTTKVAVLSKNLTDFFSANTGGGATNKYTGLDMVSAHNPAVNARMGVKATGADYTKFEGYVGAAAGMNGVTDQKLIGEIVTVLESLRAPIVQAN